MRLFSFRRQQAPIVPKKIGRVLTTAYIGTSEGQVVPFEKLRRAEIKKSSKQAEQKAKTWADDQKLAARPYDPESYLALYESNAILFRTINQIAVDVAGRGWKLSPKEEKGDSKEEELINEFLAHPNPEEPLRKILEALIIDWGTVGFYALEVARNDGGEVSEVYHAPAHTLWVHKGDADAGPRDRYCQKRNSKKVWFKRFGVDDSFSKETGAKGDYSNDASANEMIFQRGNYYPLNDYYGVPNILPAAGSALGLIGIRDYNLSFFTNYGIPAYLITLTGNWEDDAGERIGNFLNTEVKRSDNAHKTLVLDLPEEGEAKFEPLSVKEKEGSFRIFHQIWREDILAAYSMPPYRIGIAIIGKLGGNIARESMEIYNQSVVEPLQSDLEDIFNLKLIEQGLGCKTWKWKLNDLETTDLDREVERYNSLVEHGMLMPNEGRKLLNLGEPYPAGNKFYTMGNLKEIVFYKEEENIGD